MGDEYTIISAKTRDELIEKVNILMKLGWYAVGAAFKAERQWHQTLNKFKDTRSDEDGPDDDGDDDPKTPGGGPSPGLN